MSDKHKEVIRQISDKVTALLEEKTDAIFAAFKRAYQDYEGEANFKFPVSIAVTIEPISGGYAGKAQISYAVREKFSCEYKVSTEPDMFEPRP